jgi:hypothetical protein
MTNHELLMMISEILDEWEKGTVDPARIAELRAIIERQYEESYR